MRALTLKATDRRFLPHTVTVFNAVTATELLAVTLHGVNMSESAARHQTQSGPSAASSFRLVVDLRRVNAGGRRFCSLPEWTGLNETARRDRRFTLYRDMWLIRDGHGDFADGSLVPQDMMTLGAFAARGLRLLKTSLCESAGLADQFLVRLTG